MDGINIVAPEVRVHQTHLQRELPGTDCLHRRMRGEVAEQAKRAKLLVIIITEFQLQYA